jgi:tRNA threonylcarbamoyladenosine biosynthesis protein TsaE
MNRLTFYSPDEAFTFELGRRIGQRLEQGDILALWGELGAGKTFFTGAIARGLGVPAQTPVTSPTFTFINEYEGNLHLYHLDLYRLSDIGQLEDLPWREALFGKGVAVVEWPERLGNLIPDPRWDIRLDITGDESRAITIEAHGEHNRGRMDLWGPNLSPAPLNRS